MKVYDKLTPFALEGSEYFTTIIIAIIWTRKIEIKILS